MAKINKGSNSKCDCKPIHIDKKDIAVEILKDGRAIEDMTKFFKSFSDATRLKILTILNKLDIMCVCDIAVALNMTMSATSHQLKYLKKFNLIKSEKHGKIVFYSLADEHVRDILDKGIEHIMEEKK